MICIPGQIKIEYFLSPLKMAQLLPPELIILIYEHRASDPGVSITLPEILVLSLILLQTAPNFDRHSILILLLINICKHENI